MRLEGVSSRLDGVAGAVELTRTELSERMDQLPVVGAVHAVRDALLEDRRVRQTVDDREARIRVLERRVG